MSETPGGDGGVQRYRLDFGSAEAGSWCNNISVLTVGGRIKDRMSIQLKVQLCCFLLTGELEVLTGELKKVEDSWGLISINWSYLERLRPVYQLAHGTVKPELMKCLLEGQQAKVDKTRTRSSRE